MMIDEGLQQELRAHGFVGKGYDVGELGPGIIEVKAMDGGPLSQVDYNQIADILDFYYPGGWDDRSLPKKGAYSFQFEVV